MTVAYIYALETVSSETQKKIVPCLIITEKLTIISIPIIMCLTKSWLAIIIPFCCISIFAIEGIKY